MKAVIVLAAVALSAAVQVQPQGHEVHHEVKDYYAPPHYDFVYKVEDGHTGDVKSHHEERVGDQVKGVYMQHQPDGTILEVRYSVDKYNGYKAEVKRLGKALHPEHN